MQVGQLHMTEGMETTTRRLLTVFMTRRMSLAKWSRIGVLRRELAVYEKLHQKGVNLALVSYGGTEELPFIREFPWLIVCHNRWKLPRWIYEHWMPRLHADVFRRSTWFKTNQSAGGAAAVSVARSFRRPLIARSGYLWSDTEARRHGTESIEAKQAQREEAQLYEHAARIVVTTKVMHDTLAVRVAQGTAHRIRVVPNFVDTHLFRPQVGRPYEWDIVYVGRMSTEKNVDLLLQIASQSQWRVLLIGTADDQAGWAGRMDSCGPNIQWIPSVPHEELPNYLTRARILVLPSSGEGHPKVILEALACGVPVVATRVSGIQELVQHRQTAFLCRLDALDLHRAINTVLADRTLQEHLRIHGRELIERQFSLEHVASLEYRVLEELWEEQRDCDDNFRGSPDGFGVAARAQWQAVP